MLDGEDDSIAADSEPKRPFESASERSDVEIPVGPITYLVDGLDNAVLGGCLQFEELFLRVTGESNHVLPGSHA